MKTAFYIVAGIIIVCGIFGTGFFFGFAWGFDYGRKQQDIIDRQHLENAAPVSQPTRPRFRVI